MLNKQFKHKLIVKFHKEVKMDSKNYNRNN